MKNSVFRTAGISRGAARGTCVRLLQARSRDDLSLYGRAGRLRPAANRLGLEGRKLLEAEFERCRLGLRGGQGWGAGGQTEAVQDGADGLGRLDRGEEAEPFSTSGARQGVHSEGALFILHLAQ